MGGGARGAVGARSGSAQPPLRLPPCTAPLAAAAASLTNALSLVLGAVRLALYAVLLLPGFVQVALFYFRSPRVVRRVRYGPAPRNTVDVYLPRALAAGVPGGAAAVVAAASAAVERGAPALARPPPAVTLPVVIYITGGAWTVGHSAWGALLARRLSSGGRVAKGGGRGEALLGGGGPGSDASTSSLSSAASASTTTAPATPAAADPCIVMCVDYRNWPAASAAQAAADVAAAVGWGVAATPHLGGDPARVHLVGQSCGAALGGLALLAAAGREGRCGAGACGAAAAAALLDAAAAPSSTHDHHRHWRASALASFTGVSGVYDLDALAAHLEARGIGEGGGGRRWLEAVAAGPRPRKEKHGPPPTLASLSPAAVLAAASHAAASKLPPRISLFHGDADTSSPPDQAGRFVAAAQGAGLPVRLGAWKGATHTSPLVEGPLRGGDTDLLTAAVRGVVRCDAGNGCVGAGPAPGPPRRLCAEALVRWAERVCPF